MKKILTILLFFATVAAHAQVKYQPFWARVQYPGAKFDSTIHIPTFPGLPTLNGSRVTNQGAIAIDSLYHNFYWYDPSNQSWNLGGAGGGGGLGLADTIYVLPPALGVSPTHDSLFFLPDSLPQLRYKLAIRDTTAWSDTTLIDRKYFEDRLGTFTGGGGSQSMQNTFDQSIANGEINPVMDLGSDKLYITGNNTQAVIQVVGGSSNLVGIKGGSDNIGISGSGGAVGINGTSISGTGGLFSSSTGIGLISLGGTDAPYSSQFQTSSSDTTEIKSNVDVNRTSYSGEPHAGFGTSIDYHLTVPPYAANISKLSNQLISKWINIPDSASRSSQFSITGVDTGTKKILLTISGAGIFNLSQGLPNYANNAAAIAGGLIVNDLYRNGDAVQIVH